MKTNKKEPSEAQRSEYMSANKNNKKNEYMKSKFLQVCIGVSIVCLSVGFLLRSANTAHAAPDKVPTPKDFMAQGGGKIGKYMCSMCAISGGKNSVGNLVPSTFEVIILDTETGKTICYTADADNWKWVRDPNQIPATPF